VEGVIESRNAFDWVNSVESGTFIVREGSARWSLSGCNIERLPPMSVPALFRGVIAASNYDKSLGIMARIAKVQDSYGLDSSSGRRRGS
jgi:hypothetical protein